MKRTLQRSWLIFIFVIAFLVGMGFLVVETIFSASDWVDQPFNGHVAGAGGLAEAGEITDRNDDVLAKTVDGKRVYNDDSDVRKSLLHTVGDDSLNISTAIQSQFRSQLTGYSFIWGLDMPQSFRGGRDLKLTVDSETCKAAYNALKEYDSGACVVYNYETGEIICKVSTKTYDPSSMTATRRSTRAFTSTTLFPRSTPRVQSSRLSPRRRQSRTSPTSGKEPGLARARKKSTAET